VPEDARRRRVEIEHCGSEVLEPSFSKQTCQLVGGRRRSGRGGTGTAGLGYQSDTPAGPQPPGEFAEPGGWVGPHANGIDCKRGVEWPVADGQALDRRVDQADPSGPYGGPIAAAGLADHYLRMVDADHQSPDRSGGEGGDGHARTAANFDDTVGRLDVEQLHRPAVARHVRRAPAHDSAGGVPYGSGRLVELCQPPVTSPPLHDAAEHPLLAALLRYAEARHDGAVISAWAQIAMANSSKATANRRFTGSSVASS
jgi:hypothetical protein